jgi:hypothetical protein
MQLGEVETGRVAGGRRRAAATKDDGGLAVVVIGRLDVAGNAESLWADVVA